MEVKLIEVRDRATTMPVLAIRLEPRNNRDRWLMQRTGFDPHGYVLFIPLVDAPYDPFDPPEGTVQNRTRLNAHLWLRDHWDETRDGSVLDVEHILGETATPKASEQRGWAPEDETSGNG